MPDIVAPGTAIPLFNASAVVDPIKSPIEPPSEGQIVKNRPADNNLEIIPILTGVSQLEADLFKNKSDLKLLTSKVAMHLSPEQRQRLFGALDRLLAIEDWEEESFEIDLKAFQSFLRFVIYARIGHIPNVGVGPGGTVLAGWHVEEKSVYTEFWPADQCTLIIRLRSDRGLERFAWRGHVARLRDVVARNDAIECLESAENRYAKFETHDDTR